jgi:neutral ceramidase
MSSAEYGPGLRVGAASIDITPTVGVAMQGYGLRHAAEITDPLLASALAVGSDSIEWLLLSVDAIGLDRGFTAPIRKLIGERLSLAPSAITIACSHTHSGPATLPHLGSVTADDSYLAFLKDRLIAVAEMAANNLQPAQWRIGTSSLAENINRRLRRRGEIELDSDPDGPVDNRLRVVRVDHSTGLQSRAPIALVVHYACHATTSGGVPHISADWPGVMRAALQRLYERDGERPTICFLQGCTGDVTHRLGRNREAWPQHFAKHTAVQSQILGRLAAAAAINASERSNGLLVESAKTIIEPITLPFHGRSDSETTELQLVRLGPATTNPDSARASAWIVGLPAEPFTFYGTELGRQFHHEFRGDENNVLVCGYTNDCVGYLCTPKALHEGGYESSRAHEMYHRPAAFSAASQKIIFDHAKSAAKRLLTDAPTREPGILNALNRWLSEY